MFRSLGFSEIVVILLVALVLFGGKGIGKLGGGLSTGLANLGRGIAEGIKGFRSGFRNDGPK
jgi:Sec-independent protein translocase protein TatA